MFFSKIVILAVATVAGLAAAATPPPCLLAAVNTQPNPGDLKSICNSSNATDVQSTIVKVCNNDAPNALAAFADACKIKGITVSSYTATATGSLSTATAAGSGGSSSPTGNSTVSSGGSPKPTTTAAAGSSNGASGLTFVESFAALAMGIAAVANVV